MILAQILLRMLTLEINRIRTELKMSSILTPIRKKNDPKQPNTMKRYIILTILTILTVIPAMAQKDLSELNGMTDGQVKKTYGRPKEYTANHEYTMSSYFRYDDMEIFYTQSH